MAPAEYFRAGAAAWIVNAEGKVLACERAGMPGAWQAPQGGLRRGESPKAAVLREIREETGLRPSALSFVRARAEPLVYELPPAARSAKTGRGQVQYWFLFRLRAGDDAIRLPRGGEFGAYRWLSAERLVAKVVAFKRPVYRRVAAEFARPVH
jgi:putative (di)nucleoside polyphosphate hydrolase